MRIILSAALALLAVLACSSTAAVQQPAPSETTTSAVGLDSLYWTTALKDARKVAKKHDLDILVVFAGSDWCRPCKRFKEAVLDDAGFRESMKDDVAVLYLDFPSKRRNQLPPKQKAANEALAEQYNQQGIFPRILLLKAEQSEQDELKYVGQDAAAFEQQLLKLLGA